MTEIVNPIILSSQRRWLSRLSNTSFAWLRRLVVTLDIFGSVSICCGVFAGFKFLHGSLALVNRLLYRGALGELLESFAPMTIALSSLCLFVLVTPLWGSARMSLDGISVVRVATYVALLAILRRCVLVAVEVPPTLSEIRTQAQVGWLESWVAT